MTARSGTGLAARILLTLLGAAGLIVGAVLEWWDGVLGTDLTVKTLYQDTFTKASRFLTSVGFVSIALGLVAVLGLAWASGWLTRLAGALGIVMFILVAIQGYQVANSSVDEAMDHTDVGLWIALAGALVALVGGFFGRPRVVTEPTTVPADRYERYDHDDRDNV